MLSNLIFTTPWLLSALALLPLLWYILRTRPPAPKRVILPTTQFLQGLVSQDQTRQRTPWWLLLLRMLTAALIIIALAGPVLNPQKTLPGGASPLRIVIDNSWAGAANWRQQQAVMRNLLEQAGRNGRRVYLLPLATAPGKQAPNQHGPMRADKARQIAGTLEPAPWAPDWQGLIKKVKATGTDKFVQSIWLSGNLGGGRARNLAGLLQEQGALRVYKPSAAQQPLMLRHVKDTPSPTKKRPVMRVFTPGRIDTPLPFGVQALDEQGRLLDRAQGKIDAGDGDTRIAFDMPPRIRRKIARIRVAGSYGAAATYLFHTTANTHVGIADGGENDSEFKKPAYYLEKALSPNARITRERLPTLLEGDERPGMLILPDIARMPAATLDKLKKWVNTGGLLLRFAGPKMARHAKELLPVSLRRGGRAMEGALTWEKPPDIKAFPEASPLYGLEIDKDIKIRRQLLANMQARDDTQVWARLDDGTPLITARAQGDGLIVLVHTTASPQWSNLALSGLYVRMLAKFADLAGNPQAPGNLTAGNVEGGVYQPARIMDAYGALKPAGNQAYPVRAPDFAKATPDARHPPGYYRHAGSLHPFNLGQRLSAPRPLAGLPAGVTISGYDGESSLHFQGPLLAGAAVLFLLDWLVIMGMSLLDRRMAASALIALMTGLMAMPNTANAQDSRQMIQYAGSIHLAYLDSGRADVNAQARRGLQGLRRVLTRRTSVEPEGVVQLDLDSDKLVFFPLIYWPVTPATPKPDSAAINKLQSYLDQGGMVLIDTRDADIRVEDTAGLMQTRNGQRLQAILGQLDIPPLTPAPEKHVLGKSFYLLDHYPGYYTGARYWVEKDSLPEAGGISAVMIGAHDWARAWAPGSLSGNQRQREMSLRFGVNLVMYALTGNYKDDQVHMQEILDRLGEQ
jgi:hypothetical protein